MNERLGFNLNLESRDEMRNIERATTNSQFLILQRVSR